MHTSCLTNSQKTTLFNGHLYITQNESQVLDLIEKVSGRQWNNELSGTLQNV